MKQAKQPEVVAAPAPGLDVHGSLVRLGELFVKRTIEPACGGVDLWNNGLGAVVDGVVAQQNLPRSITMPDVARELGILPKGGRR